MALIPWKSFSDLEKFFEDDWFLPVFSKHTLTKPAINLKETEKEFVAEVEVPGFDPKNIEVSVENGMLRVKGMIDEEKEEREKDYWRHEFRQSSFERVISLPKAVKENQIEATYEKGILKIVMPKAKEEKATKVKIKVKEK
ncbi:MAG: hypothetical protein KatS3mg098_482 [Candidatus Parcubacteria bacterium]|nr:Hsp20/alpha crystallin family protein [Patescibacteria group bacterium]BCX16253.1 MAG: hypothetical protein KatS3mg098_482 [Candidatus Parcubacteria bacterium]